jgi:hypothetical protein
MRATRTKTKITFTGIQSEGMLDDITYHATKTGCKYVQSDYATKVVVTGTAEQIEAYTKSYNN